MSVSATQYFVSGLRCVPAVLLLEGLIEADLSQAALFGPGSASSPLPSGISRADARRCLALL